MLSRVASSIYWMARYVERAENLARFIDVTMNFILDQPHDASPQWEPLVRTTGDDKHFAEHYGAPTRDNVIQFLTFDREYPNSILSALTAARENARSMRETISTEIWEQLNEFYYFVKHAARDRQALHGQLDFFHEVRRRSHLFNGVTDATMSHGKGWNFLNIGRLLERADKTSRLLDVKYFTLLPNVQDVGTTIDDLQWSAVLRSVSGFEMYRKRYHGITLHRIVEFLVLDRLFPRAIHYCLLAACRSLHDISGTPDGAFRNLAEQHMGRLRSELAYLEVDAIVEQGMHEFIDALQTKLNGVDDALSETFFELRPLEQAQSQSQSQFFSP